MFSPEASRGFSPVCEFASVSPLSPGKHINKAQVTNNYKILSNIPTLLISPSHYTLLIHLVIHNITPHICTSLLLLAYGHFFLNMLMGIYTRPPIHLVHRIKSILCYEEEGPVSYE